MIKLDEKYFWNLNRVEPNIKNHLKITDLKSLFKKACMDDQFTISEEPF